MFDVYEITAKAMLKEQGLLASNMIQSMRDIFISEKDEAGIDLLNLIVASIEEN